MSATETDIVERTIANANRGVIDQVREPTMSSDVVVTPEREALIEMAQHHCSTDYGECADEHPLTQHHWYWCAPCWARKVLCDLP